MLRMNGAGWARANLVANYASFQPPASALFPYQIIRCPREIFAVLQSGFLPWQTESDFRDT